MNVAKSRALGDKWKKRLDLSRRQVPEFYETADAIRDTPHAGAIRAAIEELGMSAVFCVQGVPTAVILSLDEYDRNFVIELHAALWNQGLASLFLVISGDTLRAFSLARKPYKGRDEEFDQRCLIQTLDAATDVLALRNLIYGAESGRLWKEHKDYFRPEERVDQVLLNNLTESHRLLCEDGLSSDAAQALLIQVMFIAYLEDRGITTQDYFLEVSDNTAAGFPALLDTGDTDFINRLFGKLRADFNGDLFIAPCSFEKKDRHPPINPSHLEILTRFRSGREEMRQGASQYRFWGYNFKYIPIELISAVYDRFLAEKGDERKKQGAYYTPMFLADTVVSQVWDSIPASAKDEGRFLDPACGSGVFLVRVFQRLCEHWRATGTSETIDWPNLRGILLRLNGWDLNGSAVRVAVFSLYVALLEEVSPPDIRLLTKRGKFLPELWGKTLRTQDFFTARTDLKFDVIIGNPPWISRKNPSRSSIEWCKKRDLPMPSKEEAWAFVWKSLRHLHEKGIVAFLLPAMGFLHNHAESSLKARKRLLTEARIDRIINFSDLRFQLFEKAVRPAALLIFGPKNPKSSSYRFDYWAPKADLNLKLKRLITLGSADKRSITSEMAIADPHVFKRRLWMSGPDAKLFNYLFALPKLDDTIVEYGSLKRGKQRAEPNTWIIGQGFKPANQDKIQNPAYQHKDSELVATTPYLPISAFTPLAQATYGLHLWKNGDVHSRGFEAGFSGPRILIPQGISTTKMRLQASYTEKPLTFQHSIQAITAPSGQERRARLLTALLNSRVAIWFAFHGTGCFGSDRPKVLQGELLHLPFPSPEDTPNPEQSRHAEVALVAIVDQALEALDKPFEIQGADDEDKILVAIDRHTYEYFCLSYDEITLIDDAVDRIIPAVQPSKGAFPQIWKPAGPNDREAYATTLIRNLRDWFEDDSAIDATLEARNRDFAILRLTLRESKSEGAYSEKKNRAVGEALSRLSRHIHQPLPGNFQLIPDFRAFAGNHMYLVKPMQKRFWLRSTALADADAIALDLQDFIGLREQQDPA